MRRSRLAVGGVIALWAGLLATALASWADLNLDSLGCVKPQVALLKDKTIGVTQEELQVAVVAKVKAKLPNLHLDAAACSNVLYLGVSVMATGEEGRSSGHFGAVRLEVLRSAIILDTLARTQVTAWQQESLLGGPPGSERATILNTLDSLIGNFASAYQKAGNP